MKTIIVGAGMAGLLAAESFPDSEIWQNTKEGNVPIHNALLRFRSPEIGERLGIPFKKVRVHKNIWRDDPPDLVSTPTIREANMYSQKVTGGLYSRSIWKTDPCDRWIAPPNFHNILLKRFKDRIRYETTLTKEKFLENQYRIVSTAPLPLLASWIPEHPVNNEKFERKGIYTFRYKITCPCDVYQTVYIPQLDNPVYRVSITKDILIIESTDLDRYAADLFAHRCIEYMFGIPQIHNPLEEISESSFNSLGKLSAIDDSVRKNFLHYLSSNHNVYSLGRFATWRNLLMDDLPKDINIIKRLMYSDSLYDSIIGASK